MTPLEFRTIRISLGFDYQQMADFLGLKSSRIVRYYESGQRIIPKWVIIILELNKCAKKNNKEINKCLTELKDIK